MHYWSDRGVELIILDGMALMSKIRDMIINLVQPRLSFGVLTSIEEQYRKLAPFNLRVLVSPSRKRTEAIVELLQDAVHIHDTCKSILRRCARAASKGVLESSGDPEALA